MSGAPVSLTVFQRAHLEEPRGASVSEIPPFLLDQYCDEDGEYLRYVELIAKRQPTSPDSEKDFQEMGLGDPRYALYLILSYIFDLGSRYIKIPSLQIGIKFVSDYVLGKFRPPELSYKDHYINKALAENTRSFMEGMEFLTKKHKMNPQEAFQSLIRYILTRRQISLQEFGQNPEVVDSYYHLTKEDVLAVAEHYSLELEQMDRIAGETSAGVYDERFGEEIRKPILDLLHTRDGVLSQREVHETMNETKRAAARLKGRLERTQGEVTRGVLRVMVDALKPQLEQFRQSGFVPDSIGLPLGSLEVIPISLAGFPQEERLKKLNRFLESWEKMLESVEQEGRLGREDAEMILSLSGEYPQIERFKRLSGTVLEGEIEAAERGIDFLLGAIDLTDPMGQARKRLLQRLSESPSGMLGYAEGDGKIRVILWAPTMKIYEREASRVGPYTFYESVVAWIDKRGNIRYEPALGYIDRRGHPGLITVGEMHALLELEKNIGEKTIAKAFERFITDVKQAWESIDWKDDRARVDMGKDPRGKVHKGAKKIREMAKGYELIRRIRQTSNEILESRIHHVMSREQMVKTMARIAMDFESFFAEAELRGSFLTQMNKLADALFDGGGGEVLRVRGEIKDLIYKAMDQRAGQDFGRLTGNVKTVIFGEEVSGWLKVAKHLDGASMEDLRELARMRENQGVTPSLKMAREFFTTERYADALNEYGRIAIDGRTEVSTRLTALVELFRVAYFVNDIDFMNKAIGELDYLLSAHQWNLKPDEREMMRFALGLEKAGLLKLGHALRAALENGDGTGNDFDPNGPAGSLPKNISPGSDSALRGETAEMATDRIYNDRSQERAERMRRWARQDKDHLHSRIHDDREPRRWRDNKPLREGGIFGSKENLAEVLRRNLRGARGKGGR